MDVAKTKKDLLKLDDDVAAEVEAHELASVTRINSKVNVLKHRTKISKETFNWIQHSEIIIFYLHPFFSSKNTSLACCVYGVKKGKLKDWFSNPNFMSKWLPFARMMDLGDTTFSLPPAWEKKHNVKIVIAN